MLAQRKVVQSNFDYIDFVIKIKVRQKIVSAKRIFLLDPKTTEEGLCCKCWPDVENRLSQDWSKNCQRIWKNDYQVSQGTSTLIKWAGFIWYLSLGQLTIYTNHEVWFIFTLLTIQKAYYYSHIYRVTAHAPILLIQ